jgi:hypothetical protein
MYILPPIKTKKINGLAHITDKSKTPRPDSQQIDVDLYNSLIQELTKKNWVVPVVEIKDLCVPNDRL